MGDETTTERFWSKVDKTEGCWLWTGAPGNHGYGQLRVGGREGGTWLAHRYAYLVGGGILYDGDQVDHLCGERLCVRPDHLRRVTPSEHTRDGWKRGQMRRSDASLALDTGVCLRGHDVTEEGALYVYPDGRRQCRRCYNDTRNAWRRGRSG